MRRPIRQDLGTRTGDPRRRSSWLARARHALCLSSRDLAALVGAHQPDISRWETGARPIPPEMIPDLADALEVDPDAIYISQGLIPPWIASAVASHPEAAVVALRRVVSWIEDPGSREARLSSPSCLSACLSTAPGSTD